VAASFRWDNFVLDADAYRLDKAGVAVPLEPKAFDLLTLMVQRPGHLFSKQEIFDAVWPDTAVTDHALTRVIAQLRRALGDEAREATYIETVPTRGYRWIRPVEQTHAEVESSASSLAMPGNAIPAGSPGQAVADHKPDRRWMPGAMALVGLAAAVVALLLWAQRSTLTSATGANGERADENLSKRHDVAWPVQITSHQGLDLHPALSPQGDAVAYVSDRTGAFEIYVRALGGTATDTPLTNDGGQNVQPAWSPDGRYLAYHSYRRGGIWLIPARGGVPRQVAAAGSNPAWSPDGTRLAFQSDEHADVTPTAWLATSGSTIWVVDADGRNARELTRLGSPLGGHASPTWSRDGRFLAFTVFEAGPDCGLWLLNLASNAVTVLERDRGFFEPVFAPDGRSIYVAGGAALITRLPFDPATGTKNGEREHIPVAGVPGVRGLTIAADGRRLAFAGLALSSQIWAQPVRSDGTVADAATALTSDTSRRNSLPVISPDGSKIAYLSTRSGQSSDVWVMGVDGREPLQLTADEGAESKPGWFPDSRRVAFLSSRKNALGLFAVDVFTRREEQFFDFTRTRHQPNRKHPKGWVAEFDLAPSVSRTAFSVMPSSGRRVMYVSDLDAFSPRAVSDGSVSVGYPSWSPDERQLAVQIKDGSSTQAGIIDVTTGQLRRLTNERGHTWVSSWSPNGRLVAAASLRDGLWRLEAIDVQTGRQAIVTPPAPPHVYVRYPEWSPRGNVVVFERGELRGNIWTLAIK
jgi:Tol biopolymer transport system component/DNA-binding winged helix-turn-helix (wHTH) protein